MQKNKKEGIILISISMKVKGSILSGKKSVEKEILKKVKNLEYCIDDYSVKRSRLKKYNLLKI